MQGMCPRRGSHAREAKRLVHQVASSIVIGRESGSRWRRNQPIRDGGSGVTEPSEAAATPPVERRSRLTELFSVRGPRGRLTVMALVDAVGTGLFLAVSAVYFTRK